MGRYGAAPPSSRCFEVPRRWALLACFAAGCLPAGERPAPPPSGGGGEGGSGESPPSPDATAGGGAGGGDAGWSSASGGTGGSGGGGVGGGGGGTPDAGRPDGGGQGGGPAVGPGADARPGEPDRPESAQGPVAEGRIVFSQDFENGMEGITRSPTNLPADRAEIAEDPLGQRGKVMKVQYRMGDNFQTGGGSTHTRSWISNTGYSFPVGSTVHIAWGYLTTSRQIDAAFGQVIRPGGPMWLIEGNGDGTTYVNCRSCGGKANLPVQLEPNRWYDIRVEMTYASGGPIVFWIDGTKVLERRMTVNDPGGHRAHWDGGIYNHAAGTYTRTVYVSNLSIGLK